MRNIYAALASALAFASCAAPSQNPEEQETDERISIEYLHANIESLFGKTVDLRGYVRAGAKGGGPTCEVSKSKNSWKLNERVFLHSEICFVHPQMYKEGMATVRGVVFSSDSDDPDDPDHAGEFLILNRIYSRELKDVSIKWDK